MFKAYITFALALLLANIATTVAVPIARPQYGTLHALSRRGDSLGRLIHLEKRVDPKKVAAVFAVSGYLAHEYRDNANKHQSDGKQAVWVNQNTHTSAQAGNAQQPVHAPEPADSPKS